MVLEAVLSASVLCSTHDSYGPDLPGPLRFQATRRSALLYPCICNALVANVYLVQHLADWRWNHDPTASHQQAIHDTELSCQTVCLATLSGRNL